MCVSDRREKNRANLSIDALKARNSLYVGFD